jgi:hypothetical protein
MCSVRTLMLRTSTKYCARAFEIEKAGANAPAFLFPTQISMAGLDPAIQLFPTATNLILPVAPAPWPQNPRRAYPHIDATP